MQFLVALIVEVPILELQEQTGVYPLPALLVISGQLPKRSAQERRAWRHSSDKAQLVVMLQCPIKAAFIPSDLLT